MKPYVKYTAIILFMANSLCAFSSSPNENDNVNVPRGRFVSPSRPKETPKEHEYTHPKKASAPQLISVGVNKLSVEIDYSYGYEGDKKNFLSGWLQTSGVTKDWMVLVNIHTDMPLNTTNVFDPATRTLKWASPFENARNNLLRVGDPHEQSALIRDWTSGKHRKNVSFIFIPPDSQIEYVIGYASPQQAAKYEDQAGGGMQIRLKNLPKGTIVLDTKLLEAKKDMGQPASLKNFSLDKLIRGAIRAYNDRNPADPLPESLSDPKKYNYDYSDIAEVNEHHLKL